MAPAAAVLASPVVERTTVSLVEVEVEAQVEVEVDEALVRAAAAVSRCPGVPGSGAWLSFWGCSRGLGRPSLGPTSQSSEVCAAVPASASAPVPVPAPAPVPEADADAVAKEAMTRKCCRGAGLFLV